MKTAPAMDSAPETAWSGRRLAGLVGLILLGQLALVFLLGSRKPTVVSVPDQPTAFRMQALPVAAEDVLDVQLASDPTLFAVPHMDGFSGRAWLQLPPAEHDLPDWNEPVRWLETQGANLGLTFQDYARSNVPPPASVVKALLPEMISDAVFKPVAAKSTFEAAGAITNRLLPFPTDLVLNAWRHTEPLDPTVVTIAINGSGDVLTTRLLESSRFPAADRKALEISRTLLFRPVNGGPAAAGLTWGELTFRWETLPAKATNGVNGISKEKP